MLFLVKDDLFLTFVKVNQVSGEDVLIHQVKLLSILETKGDVLQLDVSVNQLADAVHIVQTHQQLLSDLSHLWHGNTSVVVLLHEIQEVLTKDLKSHHEMFPVLPMMKEPIEHLEAVSMLSVDLEVGLVHVFPH